MKLWTKTDGNAGIKTTNNKLKCDIWDENNIPYGTEFCYEVLHYYIMHTHTTHTNTHTSTAEYSNKICKNIEYIQIYSSHIQ